MLQKSGRLVLWEAMFILELHSAETQVILFNVQPTPFAKSRYHAFHHYVTTFVHKTAFTSWTYSIIKSCKHDFISLICPWLNYFATMLTILPGT